jgi:hypothetical protein
MPCVHTQKWSTLGARGNCSAVYDVECRLSVSNPLTIELAGPSGEPRTQAPDRNLWALNTAEIRLAIPTCIERVVIRRLKFSRANVGISSSLSTAFLVAA